MGLSESSVPPPTDKHENRPSPDGMIATREMAVFCLAVVAADARGRPPPPCPDSIPETPAPVFVTLRTQPGARLRGCLGNLGAAPLRQQLRDYAVGAARRDSRFEPVRPAELPSLSCSVSVLHSFEPCRAWDDFTVGVHGVRLDLDGRRATYLPSVAPSQGWGHRQLICSLVAKSGYSGECTPALLRDLVLTRYQVSSASADYRDCNID